MQLLNDRQIKQKIKRLAIQILEENYDEPEIIFIGLNNNGLSFAELILDQLQALAPSYMKLTLTRVRLNPANPIEYDPFIELPLESLNGKVLIVVDDVANTGRTVFYAIKPLLRIIPKKVEVAVLIDRKHKSFPVQCDYVGLSLATTLRNNIEVKLRDVKEMAAYLE